MDLEKLADQRSSRKYGKENLIVVLGERRHSIRPGCGTVSTGDPTYAGPLSGVSLGLKAYHIFELKDEIDPAVYDEQISMMEMVLDVDEIVNEVKNYRG